jgi:ribosomal protein S18 acetylase RimI-like enzyme
MTRVAGFTLERDAWLSTLLDRPALRLVVARDSEAVLPGGAFFATAKLPSEGVADASRLADAGFRVVDTALTFTAAAGDIPMDDGASLRLATPDDRAAVAAMARDGFRFSRFHLDPHIPPALAGRIKAAWAENFFAGRRGDAMIVASVDGAVGGFLQLLKLGNDRLIIDLIAVAARCRGRGVARAMIGRAARTMAAVELIVGTQAANTPSVRLYEGLGFRLTSAQLVLHHHGAGGRYPA